MYNISASKVSMLELPPNWSFWDWCQLIQLPAPMCGYPFWNYRPLCTCPLAHISFIHFKTSWCCSVKVAGYNLMFFMAFSPQGIALVFLQNDYSDEFRNKVVVVFLLFSFLWPFSGYNQTHRGCCYTHSNNQIYCFLNQCNSFLHNWDCFGFLIIKTLLHVTQCSIGTQDWWKFIKNYEWFIINSHFF